LRSYQSVLILKPDYDETQVQQNTESISELIKGQGGSCLKIDNWGKKRLAYKVKKNRFGIYLNIYHTCETLNVVNLEEKYRLFDPIIKYLVIRLDDKELERVFEEEKDEPEGDADSDKKAAVEEKSDSDEKVAVAEKPVDDKPTDEGDAS
jgi:small subunit ribosomal protein S6